MYGAEGSRGARKKFCIQYQLICSTILHNISLLLSFFCLLSYYHIYRYTCIIYDIYMLLRFAIVLLMYLNDFKWSLWPTRSASIGQGYQMREVESVWRRFGGIKNTVVLAPGPPQPVCQPFMNGWPTNFLWWFHFALHRKWLWNTKQPSIWNWWALGFRTCNLWEVQKLGKPGKKRIFCGSHLYWGLY